MKVIALTSLFLFSLIYSDKANAIIFIPAVILIPIAKIVALIIAGFSAPAALTSAVISKTAHKPLKKILIVSFIIVMCAALLLGLILKIANPDRPIF